jgi:hypothetical protein
LGEYARRGQNELTWHELVDRGVVVDAASAAHAADDPMRCEERWYSSLAYGRRWSV